MTTAVKKGLKFKKVKSITRPVLKFEAGQTIHILIQGPIYIGERIDEKKDPAHLCPVINLETGEENLFIAASVFEKELTKAYPDQSYVGHCFEIKRHRVEGKKYNIDTLTEIEIEEDDAAE